MPRIHVLGSSNVDLVVRLPRLPEAGETVLGGTFAAFQGGKGANQAVAAARACEPDGPVSVAFLSALGDDDHARSTRIALAREGIDLEGVCTLDREPSGVAFILVDRNGENQIAVAAGANAALEPAHVLPHLERAQPGDLLLASLEVPLETVTQAFECARARDVRTWLNPAPMPPHLPERLLSATDVILPNRIEVRALLNLPEETFPPPREIANDWVQRHGTALIVTGGKDGAWALGLPGENDVVAQAAFAVDVRDTVGAGDGFCGALAARWAEGHPWRDALRFAAAAAALSVSRDGAQASLATFAEVEAFLRGK